MDLGLKGKRAIVTGGSKGIGRRIADILAEEGCHVGICARGAEEVEEAVKSLEAKGVTAFGRALDVADKAALEAWVAEAASALGGLDIVIPNVSALAVERSEEAWQKGFEIDMMHTVRTVNAALPHLETSDAASIVIISSVSAREIDFAWGPYGAFKAALIHYAHGLAVDLAPKNIRANSLSPGNVYFDGGTWQQVERGMPDFFKHVVSLNPSGRMGTAEETARAAVFLASPASSRTSGTNLVVDGALTKGVQL
jgi:3-oxoacyl-[acyl-carrier protein] reductase